jgi:CubicO group peptidase (beta-lactamase class C family)
MRRSVRVSLGLLVVCGLSLVLAACGEATSTTAPTASSTASATTSAATTSAITTAATTSALTTAATTTVASTSVATTTSTIALNSLAPADLDAYILKLMADYNIPGLGLGLVQNGKVSYVKGYGLRDATTKAPVTENTLFAIGSTTKSFIALDMMMLVEEGKVQLDDLVIKYLPDFKLSDPDATKKLTIRHLLSQTSGLPRADERWYQNPNLTIQQIVDDMVNIQVTAQPGQMWQYCNQNYVLLGYLIEKISGQSWEDFTRQRIFTRLGMKTSNFDVRESQKASDFAAPHVTDVLKGLQPIPFYQFGGLGPAGGINSSVKEMAEYIRFQVGDGTFDGQKLVTSASMDAMHRKAVGIGPQTSASPAPTTTPGASPAATTPAALSPTAQATTAAATSASDEPVTNRGYAFGWLTEDFQGHQLIQHDGSIDGFYSIIELIPENKSGLVLLTNSSESAYFLEVLRLQLAAKLLGITPTTDLNAELQKNLKTVELDNASNQARLQAARSYKADPAALQAWLGDYTTPAGEKVVVTAQGSDRLRLKGKLLNFSMDLELIPYKEGGFISNSMPVVGTVVTFKKDAEGTLTITLGLGANAQVIAQRLGPNAKSVEYKDPQGRFSVTFPSGFIAQTQGDLGIVQSFNPAGIIVLGAVAAGTDDVNTVTVNFIKRFDSTFDLKPDSSGPLTTPDGRIWTETIYTLPRDQTLILDTFKQKDTVYIVLVQAKTADMKLLVQSRDPILSSFKVAQ